MRACALASSARQYFKLAIRLYLAVLGAVGDTLALGAQ
jgi:hypothetical protein